MKGNQGKTVSDGGNILEVGQRSHLGFIGHIPGTNMAILTGHWRL